MVLTAVGSAGVVGAAGGDALVAPLLADEVGESERVLGDVGLEAVTAHAAVGEGFLEKQVVSTSEHGERGLAIATGLRRAQRGHKARTKTYGIAGVGQGAERLGLGADDGARADLGRAPVLTEGQRDRVGVDVVVGTDGRHQGGGGGQEGELERRHFLRKSRSVCVDDSRKEKGKIKRRKRV